MNSNPTFQAADILTLKEPQWDVLCDKMKYVMIKKVKIHKADAGYRVYAYSKVPMRKKAWQTLFGLEKIVQANTIRGKFEDYEPFDKCKRRLMARPEEWLHVIQEWGVCPSLRARPNMSAQKQAVAEAEQMAEQMAEQLRSEICRLRKEVQQLKTWLDQVRKENQQLRSGSKRKAAEMSADESEAEEAADRQ